MQEVLAWKYRDLNFAFLHLLHSYIRDTCYATDSHIDTKCESLIFCHLFWDSPSPRAVPAKHYREVVEGWRNQGNLKYQKRKAKKCSSLTMMLRIQIMKEVSDLWLNDNVPTPSQVVLALGQLLKLHN